MHGLQMKVPLDSAQTGWPRGLGLQYKKHCFIGFVFVQAILTSEWGGYGHILGHITILPTTGKFSWTNWWSMAETAHRKGNACAWQLLEGRRNKSEGHS